jgi:hypothetical protein
MKGTAARFFRLAVSLTVLVTVGWVLAGQAAKPVRHRTSLPTDWSHQHLIFSHPSTPEKAARAIADVRYRQQVQRREQTLALTTRSEDPVLANIRRRHLTHQATTKNFKRDWSENLGSGASAGAGNYPAKYSFDTTTAFCDAATAPNQPDYVVYSTGLAGSVAQASVVAYDNLYNGCSGTTPLTYWAYNTGGQVLTSPVLSEDGTQVAFVQTSGGAASLVVLKWTAHLGTPGTPVTLVPVLPSAYSVCPAPCMTEVALHDGSNNPLDDVTSSAFYDYTNDVAWVGGQFGWLHKLTGVFKGTPTEVATGGFPVHVSPGTSLSSPVYDRPSNSIFVSDSGGFLSRVDATSGAITQSAVLDASGRQIMAGPIVDSAAGVVYTFATDDGSTNCLDPTAHPVGCAGVFQFPTNFTAAATGAEATIGSSNVAKSPNPLFLGAFDSAFFSSTGGGRTGNFYVCGNTGGIPTLYQVPIVSGVMSSSTVVVPLTNTVSAACSGVTDVPNPNQPKLPSERLFVSVADDGVSSPCAAGGCVLSFVDAPWVNFNTYVIGEQVLSTQMHVETVIQSGTSAFFPGNHPVWSSQIGQTVTDGIPGDQVVWIDQGSLTAPFSPYLSSNTYVTPLIKILDPNGNVQALTTAGTTGASQPTWSTVPGTTTNDGSAQWTNVGPMGTAALPMPGGTSGMIIDNTLGTFTVPGDSEIYFTTLTDQPCATSGGTGGCAVQASQVGLN